MSYFDHDHDHDRISYVIMTYAALFKIYHYDPSMMLKLSFSGRVIISMPLE